MKKLKWYLLYGFLFFCIIIIYNTIAIYNYSFNYSEKKSDVAVVLGAASTNGKLSPVFRERVNHSINLFKDKKVDYIMFTGGFGDGETISDSKSAQNYAISRGIPDNRIFIEEESTITFENLRYIKQIMDENGYKTALIVSDPYHMKRSMAMGKALDIDCQPSPTPTTMYKSRKAKLRFLIYESFFYNISFFLFRFC